MKAEEALLLSNTVMLESLQLAVDAGELNLASQLAKTKQLVHDSKAKITAVRLSVVMDILVAMGPQAKEYLEAVRQKEIKSMIRETSSDAIIELRKLVDELFLDATADTLTNRRLLIQQFESKVQREIEPIEVFIKGQNELLKRILAIDAEDPTIAADAKRGYSTSRSTLQIVVQSLSIEFWRFKNSEWKIFKVDGETITYVELSYGIVKSSPRLLLVVQVLRK